ncbi:MAG: hypothetical protein IPJ85_09675 [Flavobacteriales bacterium]|nr:hypothetical protein [Flavobacteriales bacterium]
MGFTFPWDSWLRNELSGFCDQRMAWLDSKEVLKPGGGAELWGRFKRGDQRVSLALMLSLVVLSDWLERNGIE